MRARMVRRPAAAALLATVAALAACSQPAALQPDVLRVGYLPNVTQEVALVAARRGSFDRALAPLHVEWKAFGAGPEAVQALLAGAVDAAYVGPGPAQTAYLRSNGEALAILAGATSGGAALVVRQGAGITRIADLHGRLLATPQLGNTQDVALRAFLLDHELRPVEQGGDVRVMPITNSAIINLMRRGDLDGAWLPEPWVTMLVEQAGATILVDEKTLWPDGRFPSAVLVGARASLATKGAAMARLVAAHVAEVRWIAGHAAEARPLVAEQVKLVTGKQLPAAILDGALAHVEPTWDPMPAALEVMAAHARRLGYLPDGDLAHLVDRTLLDEALGRPPEVAR